MSVDQALVNHLQDSITLLHLNISGTGLLHSQVIHICKRGLRKSKTILSVHLCDLGYDTNQMDLIRKHLKVRKPKELHNECNMASIYYPIMQRVVANKEEDANNVLIYFHEKMRNKVKY